MATPSEGTGAARPQTRSNPLRQAASAVFALTAILPLLLFVWTVHSLGALSRLQAQVGLGLALAVALLGFWVFRRLMGRMSDLILALRRAAESASRSSARASVEAPRATVGPAPGAWARAAALPAAPASRPAAEPAPPAAVTPARSEEHTSELQSLAYLVCRLLLEKKKKRANSSTAYDD